MPTVFITGASRGIGRVAALLFAGQGYLTAVNYNRSEAEALSLICLLYTSDAADEL